MPPRDSNLFSHTNILRNGTHLDGTEREKLYHRDGGLELCAICTMLTPTHAIGVQRRDLRMEIGPLGNNQTLNLVVQLRPGQILDTLPETEHDYKISAHEAYKTREIEDANVLAGIVAQIHENKATALADAISSTGIQPNIPNLFSWVDTIKITLRSIVVLTILGLGARVLVLVWPRMKNSHQKRQSRQKEVVELRDLMRANRGDKSKMLCTSLHENPQFTEGLGVRYSDGCPYP